MSGAGRKIKRSKLKQAKKKMQQQMTMFDKIPDACLTCDKPFDRMSKEDAQSFRVVVRENENKVNLYCDQCWDKAVNILQEFSEKTQKPLDNSK